MKIMFGSATECFTDGNSVGRFIHLQGPESGPDHLPEIEAREAAIHQTALDQLTHHALAEAILKHDLVRYNIMEGPEGVFRVNESTGNVQVFVDGFGNNNRYITVLDARDLQHGVTAEEIVAALAVSPEIDAILNPPDLGDRRDRARRDISLGGIPVGDTEELGDERIPVGEPDVVDVLADAGPEMLLTDDNRDAFIEAITVPEGVTLLPGIRQSMPPKLAFTTEIDGTEEYFYVTLRPGMTVADFEAAIQENLDWFQPLEGGRGRIVELPGARAEAAEAAAAAAQADPEVDPADAEAPEETAVAAELTRETAQAAIDSLEGLRGRDLQNRINELATQLGITFPEGSYIVDGLLVVDGSVGRATREAQQHVVEVLQRNIPREADVYSRVAEGVTTADELKSALSEDPESRLLMCQLQRDLQLLGLYNGPIDGHNGVARAFGPGTTAAVTQGLEQFGSVLGIRRAARAAEVAREAETNTGDDRTNDGIDIVAGLEGVTDEEGQPYASLIDYFERNPVELPEGVEPGSPEAEDYIIANAIRMGHRDNGTGFIEGLGSYGNDSIRDVTTPLRANFETRRGRAVLMESMENGRDVAAAEFAEDEIRISGQLIDATLLDSAYIVAGNSLTTDIDGSRQRGTVEVPIFDPAGGLNEHFSTLMFENAAFINGAIVMTMQNGCEGNLVIIPVDRQKYIPPPPPVVRVQRRPPESPQEPRIVPDVPDEEPDIPGRECRPAVRCNSMGREYNVLQCKALNGNYWSTVQWLGPTGERCERDRGDDGDGCGGCGAGAGGESGEGTGGDGL